jgi:large subunit ribosomal protein L6
MSRIGEKPISVPEGVTAAVDGALVTVKGPQGELTQEVAPAIGVKIDGATILVSRADDSKSSRSLHGLFRSLIANMVEGCSKGYAKSLELQGVGFRATVKGQQLTMTVGLSSPVEYTAPEGVTLSEDGSVTITVKGPDKQKVGETAARIRAYAPAEPYKGKGVRYKGERVRRKVGKTVA